MRPFERYAAHGFRVVLYDQRGVGRSALPADGALDLAAQLADIERIRAALGVSSWTVLGHSWGGLLAMAYTTSYGDRVERLVLLAPQSADHITLRESFGHFDAKIARLADAGLIAPPSADAPCREQLIRVLPAYFHNPRHPDTAHLSGSTCAEGLGLRVLRAAVGAPYDLRPALSSQHVPTLIVDGTADPFGPVPARTIAQSMPTATHVHLEACGHLLWEECGDRFWPRLTAFLPRPE